MTNSTVIRTVFQLKRGLSTAWERNNPVLAPGEPGWTLDTHVLKVGDGKTAWNDLGPIAEVSVSEADIQKAVEEYLTKHPISIETDTSLSKPGMAADASAVRDNCLFNTDQIIFYAGDSDDNTFV